MYTGKESFAKWMQKQQVQLKGDALSSQYSAGSALGVDPKLIEAARVELDRMLELPENNEPVRGSLDQSDIEWRCGKPDYTLANLAYLKGKCQAHAKGTLEMIVENAVKTVSSYLITKNFFYH